MVKRFVTAQPILQAVIAGSLSDGGILFQVKIPRSRWPLGMTMAEQLQPFLKKILREKMGIAPRG